MTRAIPIERLPAMNDTEKDILRIISLKMGKEKDVFVDYGLIATSLNIKRAVVVSAVNRMKRKGILREQYGKLSIPIAVMARI